MPIRAIYFDLGGVLVRTEDRTPRTHLAEECGLNYREIDQVVFGGGIYSTAARASLGALTEEAHWVSITRRLGLPLSERLRIQEQFFGGDSIDWNLIAFLREARKTHKTGLISNAWEGLRAWIQRQQFTDAFDHLTISAEVRMVKPMPGIYHHALQALGVRPEEAVFVDDFSENIQACRHLGMHGILFQSPEQVLADLKRLLANGS
ncbi:MAG: HAD family phosphatase [Anaerolineales bacterium]|nr:HAD family phosphatase [Anaerolineales bacterium]MCX7755433.1 HAD family phosphatase [Anaerolineales bacterium]MDW8279000.1 HAD family phosphatase [Anaerolineales bacterium]